MTDGGFRARFALAGASVIGPAHHRVGRNNQDAWSTWIDDDFAVLAVADGCSGGAASEMGAHFAARWIVAQVTRRMRQGRTGRHEELVYELFDQLTRRLGMLAASLAPDPAKIADVVAEVLLATVLVAVVDQERTSVMGIGDGLIVVDDTPIVLTCDRTTGPEYPAYRLLDPADSGHPPGAIVPRLFATGRTNTLRRLVLATDGAHDLLPARAGRDRLTGLFEDGRVARRPALLESRLKTLASEPELLHDDVTIVALMANRPRAAAG